MPGNRYFHVNTEGFHLSKHGKRNGLSLEVLPTLHLVNIVKDKLLLKDIVHLTQFVHTTALEIYHSLYLKYLLKMTHFTHDGMTAGSMLPALDHNFNVNRPQVSTFTLLCGTLFTLLQCYLRGGKTK